MDSTKIENKEGSQTVGETPEWLRRRFEKGQLKGYPQSVLTTRAELLKPLMEKVMETGAITPQMFMGAEFGQMDERVIEYPVALLKIIELQRQRKATDNPYAHMLDVGCVLNNSIIKGYVHKLTDMIWFLNPAVEPFVYKNDFAYIVADIRMHKLPTDLSFDLVTCLSTIEHVGMDNTRYGGSKAEFEGEISDPEKFAIDAARSIARLVKPGGRLLLSVPFGPFEYLYIHGKPNEPIYYTFDKSRLLRLNESLDGFKCNIYVYKVVPRKGWIETTVGDEDILRHADGCAAAGAVAFIEAVRL